jgi:serine/threonine-protein kinase RsbW
VSEELYTPDHSAREGVRLEPEQPGDRTQLEREEPSDRVQLERDDGGDSVQPKEREEPAYESSASLRLADGPLVGPVLCRVVSIVLARANCPMDRLDDVMLICDALSAHAPRHAADGHLAFAVSVQGGQFELRVGELAEQAAGKLVEEATLPEVGSVLERMTDELRIEPAADGAGEELVLGLFF